MHIEKSFRTVFNALPDGTGVLLNLDTLLYYSLNRTGALLWQQIEAGNVVAMDELLRAVSEHFEVTEPVARQSVEAFVRQLEQFKMVRLV